MCRCTAARFGRRTACTYADARLCASSRSRLHICRCTAVRFVAGSLVHMQMHGCALRRWPDRACRHAHDTRRNDSQTSPNYRYALLRQRKIPAGAHDRVRRMLSAARRRNSGHISPQFQICAALSYTGLSAGYSSLYTEYASSYAAKWPDWAESRSPRVSRLSPRPGSSTRPRQRPLPALRLRAALRRRRHRVHRQLEYIGLQSAATAPTPRRRPMCKPFSLGTDGSS